MSTILKVGRILPVQNKSLKYSIIFIIGGKNPLSKQVIRNYEGNDEIPKNNKFLGKFILELNKNEKKKLLF